MTRYFSIFIVVLFFLSADEVTAQTCGCAGAPLLSSQTISSAAKKNLLVGLKYQYHAIDGLYNGSQKLDRESVQRNTKSSLLELHYGFTNRLTLSGTFSFISKTRTSGLQNNNPTTITTNGVGDALIMLKYVVHQNTYNNQYQLAIGTGFKAPFGDFDLTTNGIQLNADMQPGTGTWDGFLWSYLSKTFAPKTSLNAFMANSYIITGEASRSDQPGDIYKFGNEFVSTLGVGNELYKKFSYTFMIQYRHTTSHKLDDRSLANTGGEWAYIIPGISYKLNSRISLQLNGQFPIYQNLNGTQSTTSYAADISLFYSFNPRIIF